MRVPAVSQTAVASPWTSVDPSGSSLVSAVTGAQLAHDTPACVLSKDTHQRGAVPGRQQKMPKPGDLSVLGLRPHDHFTVHDRCQLSFDRRCEASAGLSVGEGSMQRGQQGRGTGIGCPIVAHQVYGVREAARAPGQAPWTKPPAPP
jgi:hypothetical protein